MGYKSRKPIEERDNKIKQPSNAEERKKVLELQNLPHLKEKPIKYDLKRWTQQKKFQQ